MPYQRILVPIDNSESSKRAIMEAKRFAHSTAKFRFIHVVDLAQFAWWNSSQFIDITLLQQGLKVAGQDILEQTKTLMALPEAVVETKLIEIWGGSLAKGILEDAVAWQADLIVMATHGHGALTHLLLGSVAEGVIFESDIPVLLVRAPEKEGD